MVGSFLGFLLAMVAAIALAAAPLAAAVSAADDDDDRGDDDEELLDNDFFPALALTSSSFSLSLSFSSSIAKERELAIFFRFSARSVFRRDDASSSRSRCLFSPSVITSLTSSRA